MRLGVTGGAIAMLGAAVLLLPAAALADTTIGFDDLPAGSIVTNQYANAGGQGQGVVFGPLPGVVPTDAPVSPAVSSAPGQARSGNQAARVDCPSPPYAAPCNEGLGYTPQATGTFAVQRSRVSVYVGLLGPPAPSTCAPGEAAPTCAGVTLLAFDSSGRQIASSPQATVTQGVGINTLLTVSTASAQIVGFEITARDTLDSNKPVAIDDLSFATASSPPPPDFTLNATGTSASLTNGQSTTDPIAIGRIGGSSGLISFSASPLPTGVHIQFAPNPADTQTVMTVRADTNAPSTQGPDPTITITGTPTAPSAGSTPHSISVRVHVRSACADVVYAEDLVNALGSGCRVVHIDDAARIDLSLLDDHPEQYPGYVPAGCNQTFGTLSSATGVIRIPDNVTLAGDRSPTREGGLLYMSHQVAIPCGDMPKSMLELGRSSRVSGLRIEGFDNDQEFPLTPQGMGGGIGSKGIDIVQPDAQVDNNEIWYWNSCGICVGQLQPPLPRTSTNAYAIAQAQRIRISDNFIHDNTDDQLGYGISVGGGLFALIQRNVFVVNKHDIAGVGDPGSGYIAEYNFTLTDGWKTTRGDYGGHFDMHGYGPGSNSEHVGGTAGTYIAIRNNAFRGDQRYKNVVLDYRRPSFDLRGTPTNRAIFENNVTEADSEHGVNVSGADQGNLERRRQLVLRGNHYSVNTSSDVAAPGNFHGGTCTDLFLATGETWEYSPCGRGEWRFLNASGYRLSQLAFGDFNGDGIEDVFTQKGDTWYASYGGTTRFKPLPAGSNIPMSTYRFGHFDGDRRTDIFRANGSRWYYSDGGASAWKPLAVSRLEVGQLRFCDFNGDGRTDVFSLANGQWSVSWGGATRWYRLNSRLSSHLGELVFGDFNGDGRCDVAREHHDSWQISWAGTSPWHYESPQQNPGGFGDTLIGHFGGDRCDDVLRFKHRDKYLISSCLTPFAVWSEHPML